MYSSNDSVFWRSVVAEDRACRRVGAARESGVSEGRCCQRVGHARRSGVPEGRQVRKEHREERAYKYMHIYLCNTLYWLVVVGC